MMLESRFSSDNAQDYYYSGDHNSNYSYQYNDNIAYGLIQWKSEGRKKGCLIKLMS